MLTWESSKIVGYEGGVAVELRRGHCLSTDTKPTGPSIGNGSYLREMDTGDEYEYDAENDIWRAGSGGGGGAGLPAVTSEDNGDVLTVVEGSWAKAAPSGGGVLWCNYTVDDETGKIDKSYNEIKAAIDNGVMPVMVVDVSDDLRTEIPNTVDIWGYDYFFMSTLVAYTTENDGPGYRVKFGEGWYFVSSDADADMVED